MSMDIFRCCFCGGSKLALKYEKQHHPVNKQIGEFDIYSCKECGSAVTIPFPTAEQLKKLYGSFQNGMQNIVQDMRKESPLTSLYKQLLNSAIQKMVIKPGKETVFTWIDVGAGDGVLSAMIADLFPNSKGFAVDFHERPAQLKNYISVQWIKADLNLEQLSALVNNKTFDLVISLAVLEHVQRPEHFVKNLASLLNHNGLLYIACPDYDSLARKLLGTKWPYHIPGEHINIPSHKGMELLLKRITAERAVMKDVVFSTPIAISYPVKYFFNYFGARLIAKLIPAYLSVPMPTGAMEAGIINSNNN